MWGTVYSEHVYIVECGISTWIDALEHASQTTIPVFDVGMPVQSVPEHEVSDEFTFTSVGC